MAREYAKVAWRFWTSRTGRRLRGDPDAQLVALYLLTCQTSTMFGLYQISPPTIAHETGVEIDAVRSALARLEREDFAYYDPDAELVLVVNMAQFQIAETLLKNDNRVKNLQKELAFWSKHLFARKFWQRYEIPFHLGPWPFGGPLAPSEGLQRALDLPPEGPSKGVVGPREAPSKPGSGAGSGSGAGDPDPERDPSAPPRTRTTEVPAGPMAEVGKERIGARNGHASERADSVGSDAGATILPISRPTPQKPPSDAMPGALPIPGSEPSSAKRVAIGGGSTVPQLREADCVPEPAPRLRPDSAHNLVWCLKRDVEAKYPERGFWIPGRFGENDAARWWLGAFSDRPVGPDQVAIIEKRIQLYITSGIGHRHGFSLRGFLEDFNRIGLEDDVPKPAGRKPLSQQLSPGQRFFDPNEEDPD